MQGGEIREDFLILNVFESSKTQSYTTKLTLQKTLDQIFSGGMSSSMIVMVSASLKVFTHEPQLTNTVRQTPQALGVVEDVLKNTSFSMLGQLAGLLSILIIIMAKELVPIVVSCAVWGPLLSKKHTEFHCDNQSLVDAINKDSSKDEMVMHLLRCLWFFTAIFNIRITAPRTSLTFSDWHKFTIIKV